MIIDIALLSAHIAEQVMNTKEPIYFAKDGQVIGSVSSVPSYAKGDFNFDLERMTKAVEAPRFDMPKFESDEEFLAWVNS